MYLESQKKTVNTPSTQHYWNLVSLKGQKLPEYPHCGLKKTSRILQGPINHHKFHFWNATCTSVRSAKKRYQLRIAIANLWCKFSWKSELVHPVPYVSFTLEKSTFSKCQWSPFFIAKDILRIFSGKQKDRKSLQIFSWLKMRTSW